MSVRVVRLGSPRGKNEGLRLGTVRRPPRGVPKARIGQWYDLWLPQLAPSAPLVNMGTGRQDTARVGELRSPVPQGDGPAGQRAAHRAARGAVAYD